MMGGLDTPTSGSVIVRGDELAQKLGCHEVDAATINLTPGLLRK